MTVALALSDRWEQWWAHRRLARGRCTQCGRVLRDDQPRGVCSLACMRDREEAQAW